jgi:hypothetical protein
MRLLAVLALALFSVAGFARSLPEHHLRVVLHPEQHSLEAEDRIILPPDAPRTFYFSLHRNMNPASPDAGIKIVAGKQEDYMQRYRVALPHGSDSFTLFYSGEIFQAL